MKSMIAFAPLDIHRRGFSARFSVLPPEYFSRHAAGKDGAVAAATAPCVFHRERCPGFTSSHNRGLRMTPDRTGRRRNQSKGRIIRQQQ
jgi:hypothetical protein